MNQQEQIEGNKLIAEFMGFRIWYKDGNEVNVETSPERCQPIAEWARYHTSWDWLMPVVEKIEKMGFNVHYNFYGIENPDVHIHKEIGLDTIFVTRQTCNENRILGWWKAVFQFIQWYNQNISNQ